MSPFTMPDIFKISVRASCPSHAQTRVTARQHTVVIDEPPARYGTDAGPTPLETLLSSYLGCTNVIANMLAQEMGVEISRLEMSLTGYFDTRGVFGRADVAVPFPTIELAVNVVSDADTERIEELKSALARRCPVSVILRQAGCKIVETWAVTK